MDVNASNCRLDAWKEKGSNASSIGRDQKMCDNTMSITIIMMVIIIML